MSEDSDPGEDGTLMMFGGKEVVYADEVAYAVECGGRPSCSLRTPSGRWAESERGRESFYRSHSDMGLSREPLRWSLA